jgi:hypothetical protein
MRDRLENWFLALTLILIVDVTFLAFVLRNGAL